MIFKKKENTNFFINYELDNIFIYSNIDENNFSIEKALNETTNNENFLIVFHTLDIDYKKIKYLDRQLNNNKKIIWLNSFDDDDNISASIKFDNDRKISNFVNFSLGGTGTYRASIKSNRSNCQLSYNNNENCIYGVCELDKNLVFNIKKSTNKQNSKFNEFKIPLKESKSGYMLFNSEPIQPSTPYILSVKGKTQKLTDVEYFNGESLKKSIEMNCVISPYNIFDTNDIDKKSYLKYRLKDGEKLKTNFLDEFGANFIVNKLESFECVLGLFHLSYIDEDGNSQPGNDNYIFMPTAESNLLLYSENSDKFLLGNSGTELLSTNIEKELKVTFKHCNKITINYMDNTLETSHKSITSIPTIQTKGKKYYFDAEKAPMFKNENSITESEGIESKWEPILKGELNKFNENFRFIPTLSFNNDTHLKIEKVFSKLRKGFTNQTSIAKYKRINSENESYITPQGYLRSGSTIDFIKNDTENKFSFIDIDTDFDLSISKEDVFFVLTPEMMCDKGIGISVKFKLADFTIELTMYDENCESKNHSQQIIIIKYGKFKLGDLIEDTSKWSNHGDYNTDLEDISQNIAKNLKRFCSKYKKDEDENKNNYKYIIESIKNDPSWNGVLILDIPLPNDKLPSVLDGLSAKNPETNKKLKIEYIALPVNKTKIDNGKVVIDNSSFYGIIDYDLLEQEEDDYNYDLLEQEEDDYNKVFDSLGIDEWNLILTKLLVRFDNSEIANFDSYAFLKIPSKESFFEDKVSIAEIILSHSERNCPDVCEGNCPDECKKLSNLFKLKGYYQKSSNGDDEFIFDINTGIIVHFNNKNKFIKCIIITQASFAFVSGNVFRFDFDGNVEFKKDIKKNTNLISFNSLKFENIGVLVDTENGIKFDSSRLKVLPDISFDSNGFFSSFPIKFNSFKVFDSNNNDAAPDFFKLIKFDLSGSMFGMIFDLDLGTLGDLSLLKKLKGKILLGWSKEGGLKIGFKFEKSKGLNIDLGFLKLNIKSLNLCHYDTTINAETKTTYFIRMKKIILTILGTALPSEEELNGLIFAEQGSKIAWLMTTNSSEKLIKKKEEPLLTLGVGQRVGPKSVISSPKTVAHYIDEIRNVFSTEIKDCKTTPNNVKDFYKPDRNWLIASEKIIPNSWSEIVDFKFIFNDPDLYGAYLALKKTGFAIDIVYTKLSNNLGVWAIEIQLPTDYRTIEAGAATIIIPNIGIEIYTDGSWVLDVGFPQGNNYDRSCLISLLPFVGYCGFYVQKSKSSIRTLFADYIPSDYPVKIIQSGMAIRIGLGKDIRKSIFTAKATLTIFGVLEGAFAFDSVQQSNQSLAQIFPDHFALQGRIGVIAEIEGRVSFSIVNARVSIVLSVEVGMLLVYLSHDIKQGEEIVANEGLQPVNLYIEGRVRVGITVTIRCIKIFHRRICIRIHYSFNTSVRFEYTLGGSSSSKLLEQKADAKLLEAKAKEVEIKVNGINYVPMTYVPTVTKAENGNWFIHAFAIQFFAFKEETINETKKLIFPKKNIFSNIILKIFTAIEKTLKKEKIENNYNNIRKILIDGKLDNYIFNFSFPDYKPLFINSKGLNNDEIPKEILTTYYHFSDGEADNYKLKDEYHLPVSAPISSKSAILEFNETNFESKDINDFTIEVNNLVDKDINVLIDEEDTNLLYTESQIQEFNDYFKLYKEDVNTNGFIAKDKQDKLNIREDFIILDFFKLLALITLEEYYNQGIEFNKQQTTRPNDKPLEPLTSYNPIINADEISNEKTSIKYKFNNHLEKIIGQINFYYNNGLRLPNLKDVNFQNVINHTSSFYNILNQAKAFENTKSDVSNLQIKFKTKTKTYDFTETYFIDNGEKTEFKDSIDKSIAVDLSELGGKFESTIVKPYKLFQTKLAIQNSDFTIEDSTPKTKFFALPEKMQYLDNKELAIKINLESHAKGGGTKCITKLASICANVECTAKLQKKENIKTLLEISSVKIDELGLIDKIKNKISNFDKINVYYKNDKTLTSLGTVTLIKTNLSTITHPPVIEAKNSSATKVLDNKSLNIAKNTKDEKADFAKLLWDAFISNNSGYYIKVKDNAIPNGKIQLVFSFTFNQTKAKDAELSKAFPSFCNYIALSEDEDNEDNKYFDSLKENKKYIFAEYYYKNEKNKIQEIQEYHPTIKPNYFGFELTRQKRLELLFKKKINKDNYTELEKYLPIEYKITNTTDVNNIKVIIDKDKVLPLMPLECEEDCEKISYKQVFPLISEFEKNRYSSIGNSIKVDFSLRDIYGFRATNITLENSSYQHKYFDKLLPLDSWPFISFSYWIERVIQEKQSNKMSIEWKLSAQVLVPEKVEDPDYQLDYLLTALDQIEDERIDIFIDNDNQHYKTNKGELKEFLVAALTQCISELNKEKSIFAQPSIIITQEIDENVLKQEIGINIKISRDEKLCIDKPQDEVLDYDLVCQSISTIKLEEPSNNTKDNESNTYLYKLNNELNELTVSKYILGLSTNKQRKKVIFLINKPKLEALQFNINKDSSLDKNMYFGILPFNNSLWSGKYEFKSTTTTFSNVDLDLSLKIILEKIDSLLDADEIFKLDNDKDNDMLNDLINAQKLLIDTKLKDKIANTENDATKPTEYMKNQFKNLLLENTSNYYKYDGVIKINLDNESKEILAEHRLSISFNDKAQVENSKESENKDYNFISSKIGHGKEEWLIFFDKLEQANKDNNKLNFKLKPQITHIEFDIKKTDNPNDIEASTWIQLLEPISLKNNQAKVKINNENPDLVLTVNKWDRIVRNFPHKPLIINSVANQTERTKSLVVEDSNVDFVKLGRWNYTIGLKDFDYEIDDKIFVNLKTRKNNQFKASTQENFYGFIAYWASNLNSTNSKDFINDLSSQTQIMPITNISDKITDKLPTYNFTCRKNIGDQQWEICNHSPDIKKIDMTVNDGSINIIISESFNIFKQDEANQVLSIKSEVLVIRNSLIKNTRFHYETETITPILWTTPNIQHDSVEVDNLNVFNNIQKTTLSYKATFSQKINNKMNDLPSIPIFQMEFDGNKKPQEEIEKYFNGYNNGYNSISITIYNESDSNDNKLPIFQIKDLRKKETD